MFESLSTSPEIINLWSSRFRDRIACCRWQCDPDRQSTTASAPTRRRAVRPMQMPVPSDCQLFCETVAEIESVVQDALAQATPDWTPLDRFDELVFLKNSSLAVVTYNRAWSEFVDREQSSLGRQTRSFLAPEIAKLSELSDRTVLGGADTLEITYRGPDADGILYSFRAYKRRIHYPQHPGLAILGIVRVEGRIDGPEAEATARSVHLLSSFRELEARDREICRLVAIGESSRQIAKQFDMTPRAIELRRQKAFERLGVESPIQLARELVRLQERGLLDLGL